MVKTLLCMVLFLHSKFQAAYGTSEVSNHLPLTLISWQDSVLVVEQPWCPQADRHAHQPWHLCCIKKVYVYLLYCSFQKSIHFEGVDERCIDSTILENSVISEGLWLSWQFLPKDPKMLGQSCQVTTSSWDPSKTRSAALSPPLRDLSAKSVYDNVVAVDLRVYLNLVCGQTKSNTLFYHYFWVLVGDEMRHQSFKHVSTSQINDFRLHNWDSLSVKVCPYDLASSRMCFP